MSQYERDLIRLCSKAVDDGNDRLYWRYNFMLETYRENKKSAQLYS